MHVLIVIPARIGSSRIPQKPLCLLDGEPLVRVVAKRVLNFSIGSEVVVASDHLGVLAATADLRVGQVLTRREHSSGTERVAEVLESAAYSCFEAVVNVQCDQPFLDESLVRGSLGVLDSGLTLGTAAVPLDPTDLHDPDRVKVRVGADGKAEWFSRSAIHARDGAEVFQHVGVYAYRRKGIERWVALPPCAQESSERLEQMRPLVRGIAMGVAVVDMPAPLAIDTPADLRRAQSVLDKQLGEHQIWIGA